MGSMATYDEMRAVIGEDKPTYEELANAFAEYVAATNNGGEPVLPTEDDVARAAAYVDASGGHYA